MQLRFKPYHLEFKYPFRIANFTRTSTPVVITEIEQEGVIGYGEASMPPYLGETHDTALILLSLAQKIIAETSIDYDINEVMGRIDAIAEGNPAAKASIDIALHDLKGKILNTPCYTFFDVDKSKTLNTSITIGISEPQLIKAKIKDAEHFKVIKVKLGSDNDREIIKNIRVHTDKPISVDVNQGWKNKEEALELSGWLKEQNVIFIEQPFAKTDLDAHAWLTERSPLPIIADESAQRLKDIEVIQNCFHGINVKLMKSTGMNEAHKMIVSARKYKLKVLIGCMSETSCAISAAAQLSPLADWADLDGSLLIKNDLFDGVKFVDGKITLNDRPGIGVFPI